MEKEVRGNENRNEKVLKPHNFYVWTEKLDAEVGARASKAGSLCKTNLPYVKWG